MAWRGNSSWGGGGSGDRWQDNRGKGGGKGGGGGGGSLEDTSNDWQCKCGQRNFARRYECFKCKEPKPGAPGSLSHAQGNQGMSKERKLKAALAMGIDPDMADTVIQDPRFEESVLQFEKMQVAQGAAPAAEVEEDPADQQYDEKTLLALALAQGMGMLQAAEYVDQYMKAQALQNQQKAALASQEAAAAQARAAEQQQQQAAAAASGSKAPDAAQLVAAAVAQGYTQEQAQQFANQYMAAEAAKAPAAAVEEKKPKKVSQFANTMVAGSIEENKRSRNEEYRCSLKACLFQDDNGRKTFQDLHIKGPWRKSRAEATRDQEELTIAIKEDGKDGVEQRNRELEEKVWDLEGADKAENPKVDDLPEDEFDAEAEMEEEPEPELLFDNEELPVKVMGEDVKTKFPGPVNTWEDGIAKGYVALAVGQGLCAMQMTKPLLIQRFSIPLIARKNCDLLAQAQTGSGKTMAFVIPMVSRLVLNPPGARPYFAGRSAQASPIALMLSPTRELAIQTNESVTKLLACAGSKLLTMTMYGGETIAVQLRPIEKQNMDIICATPGRLLDAVDSGKVSMMFCESIVLDEADQMLDMAVGLEGQVVAILNGRDLPRTDGRQTLLFSATMPDFQTKQFHGVMKPPPLRQKLRVGHYRADEKGGSCKHITQKLVRVRDMDDRWNRLGRDLMEIWGSTTQRREGKGIIFTNRIALAHPLEQALRRCGISCGQLHGKQTQDVREDIVKKYRKGEYEMLIASNVASRGLDFPDIKIVVQFELPKTVEIYTHRIGRTGRNGQTGTALSYYSDIDWRLAKPLMEFVRLNDQAPPSWLEDLVEQHHPGEGRAGGRRRERSRSPKRW